MNPAVIEPSHIPRMMRTTKSPAKFLHAAWEHRAIAQMDMFKLSSGGPFSPGHGEGADTVPHPLSDREALETEVLRKLEEEVAEVEDGPEPVLRCSR